LWKCQGRDSCAALGRRDAEITPSPGSISVSMNSLLKAGCAASVAGGDNTISL
jgi:hypothetical protein